MMCRIHLSFVPMESRHVQSHLVDTGEVGIVVEGKLVCCALKTAARIFERANASSLPFIHGGFVFMSGDAFSPGI